MTVLPVTLKVTLRCWMILATPFLELRHPPSHGFRAGFQASDVHYVFRHMLPKQWDFGAPFLRIKLDIRKAYDTLAWASIQQMFAKRGLPTALQHAYWRIHVGRRLRFRNSDGTISFALTPMQGIPQGSPESPLIYAAVMESRIEEAEKMLQESRRPYGIPVTQVWTQAEVERQKLPSVAASDQVFCFANSLTSRSSLVCTHT